MVEFVTLPSSPIRYNPAMSTPKRSEYGTVNPLPSGPPARR